VHEIAAIKGIDIWDRLTETDLSEKVQSWIDQAIFNDDKEMANIITSLKTTGVKGVANKLREFTKTHPKYNFDKTFARCSKLMMRQIKDELTDEEGKAQIVMKEPIEMIKEKIK